MPSARPDPRADAERLALAARATVAREEAQTLLVRAREALQAAATLRRERAEYWLARYGCAAGGTVLVTRCAWCRRTRDPQDERWLRIAPPAPDWMMRHVTHGICSTCAAMAITARSSDSASPG